MQEIAIRIDKNYGREAIYPANEAARIIAAIAGTKTLSRQTLSRVESLGHKIVIHEPSLNLERSTRF